MNIEFFRNHFIKYLENQKKCDIKPTIIISNEDIFETSRLFTVFSLEKKNKILILNAIENNKIDKPLQFIDPSIFNNIEEVIFNIKGINISEFEFTDIGWSDRTFYFEYDSGKYNIL